MSHPARTLERVVTACPDDGTELVELEPEAELGSRPVRYWCPYCEVVFERDPSGMLLEVDFPPPTRAGS